MSNTKQHYIFGGDAAKIYNEGNWDTIEELAVMLSLVEHKLWEYDDRMMWSHDVLEAYDGWDGYAHITEKEYYGLKDLQDL